MPDAIDPLLLGQRVVAILETGVRVATYKLATLMALIDHCIENLPAQPTDRLAVPIPDLAHRVLQLCWRQVRPFEGHDLRQSSGEKERIPRAARALRAATTASSLSVAMTAAPEVYQSSIDEIGLCLAQQPLYRLQRLPGSDTNDPFLFDDSFLHPNVSRRTLRAHGDAVVLMPGVAAGLARLAGLLKPALEIMWVDDVRRLNKFLTAEVPDIAGASVRPGQNRAGRSTRPLQGGVRRALLLLPGPAAGRQPSRPCAAVVACRDRRLGEPGVGVHPLQLRQAACAACGRPRRQGAQP